MREHDRPAGPLLLADELLAGQAGATRAGGPGGGVQAPRAGHTGGRCAAGGVRAGCFAVIPRIATMATWSRHFEEGQFVRKKSSRHGSLTEYVAEILKNAVYEK